MKKIISISLATLMGLGAVFSANVLLAKSALGEGVNEDMNNGHYSNKYIDSYAGTIKSVSNGTTIALHEKDSVVFKAMSNYEIGITALYWQPGNDIYHPAPARLSWEGQGEANYYTVKVGLKKDLSDAKVYVSVRPEIDIENLFAAKRYYYQVTAHFADKMIDSQIFSFETARLPRTITVPSVSNTRDIGGYYTEDGKYQVRQGLFYRGGVVDNISEEGKKVLLDVYGIKTDLDVRGDTDHTASPLGPTVKYVKCKGPYYVGSAGITVNQEYRDALMKEIQTCAVKENYPIYLHCSLGRDRTGTLAFLISALLGVGEKDLFMDYEMSFFSETGTKDNISPEFFVKEDNFIKLYNYIKNYTPNCTLQENAEKFILDLGVTYREIERIREIFLEEVSQ